jgi:hypothetical protein
MFGPLWLNFCMWYKVRVTLLQLNTQFSTAVLVNIILSLLSGLCILVKNYSTMYVGVYLTFPSVPFSPYVFLHLSTTIFFVVLRASCLLGRCPTTWATLPALFFLIFIFYCSHVHTMLGSFLPPAPTTPLPPTRPLPLPLTPQYLAEIILPLSLILLKREYKQ